MIIVKRKCIPVYFYNYEKCYESNKGYNKGPVGIDEVNSLLSHGWIIENTVDNHDFVTYCMALPAQIRNEEDYK